METTTIPHDIRNFLSACGTTEASNRGLAGRGKGEWRIRLGAAILRRRVSLGLTHQQVARRMGRRQCWPSLVNLEAGRNTWKKCWDTMIERLAAALETTREALEQEAA